MGTGGKPLLIENWGEISILALFPLKGSYHLTFWGPHEALSSTYVELLFPADIEADVPAVIEVKSDSCYLTFPISLFYLLQPS